MVVLDWSIRKHENLVVVGGIGVFDMPFFLSYLQAVRTGGAIGYRKLLDLRQADIQLSDEDLSSIGSIARQPSPVAPGPIAILVGRNPPPLMLDMAILMKQRIGTSRLFRLFTDESEARRWLTQTSTSP